MAMALNTKPLNLNKAKMLGRIANTEAKTPRGREIKARHAAAIAAEQERMAERRPRAEALARAVSEFAKRYSPNA
jgi:hypothetical protein